MLTGWKVSSLSWKCVFHRAGPIGKWGSHGIEMLSSWNTKIKYIIK